MRSEEYLAELRGEFPRLRVLPKEGDGFSRAVDLALRALTFGGQSGYLDRYVTTIGDRIYLPRNWDGRADVERYVVLRHEAVHLRQFRRRGLVRTAVVYLFWPVPVVFAAGRAGLEREAYEESLRAMREIHGDAALHDPELRSYIVRQFTGPAYAWMWPFPSAVGRWYDAAVKRICAEGRAT